MEQGERKEYEGDGLSEAQLAASPLEQAQLWVADALRRSRNGQDVPEPMSLSVATVDAEGRPDVRTVLLRYLDGGGPGFVTNLQSIKGRELAANPAIAAALTWPAMYRSIRFRGTAYELDREEVRTYFHRRPWGARISALASRQSEPVADRAALERAYEDCAVRYPDHGREDDVPLPDFWGGYRIACEQVEFWAGRRNRLHDRLVFLRLPDRPDGRIDDATAWRVERRQP